MLKVECHGHRCSLLDFPQKHLNLMRIPYSLSRRIQHVSLATIFLSALSFLQIPEAQSKDGEWLLKDKPSWVWTQKSADNQKLYLRKSFEIPAAVKRARVYATCDNQLRLFLNSKEVGTSSDWPYPIEKDVSGLLKPGKNVIAAQA